MRKYTNILYFIVLLSAVLLTNYFIRVDSSAESVELSECRLETGSCYIVEDKSKVEIFIVGNIKPLKPFSIVLKDSSNVITSAGIELEMKGMEMGVNKYSFIKQSNDQWKAEVVIPICTTGRRDWLFKTELAFEGNKKKTTFKVSI